MKPVLYSKTESRFDTYGLGEMDALSCEVERERNGEYTLYMEYDAKGALAKQIKVDMQIKADAGTRTKWQTFVIKRVVKASGSVIKVYAKHISHLLENMGIRPELGADGVDASTALNIWSNGLIGGKHFDVWSDVLTSNSFKWSIENITNARQALMGTKGSVLDVYGGEFEFDNLQVKLHKQLGRKVPTVLEYGRNITDIEDEEDVTSTVTSIYPFAIIQGETDGNGHQQANTFVYLPEFIVDSKYLSHYPERRVQIVNFSERFNEKNVATVEKLRNLAQKYIEANEVGVPKRNLSVKYVDLANTLAYVDYRAMEQIELCDIVGVYYPPLEITSETKVSKVRFNVLTDENITVEFGTKSYSFKDTVESVLGDKLDDFERRQANFSKNLSKYIKDSRGATIWYDMPNANYENKVGDVWFEKNGNYHRTKIWNGTQWETIFDTEDVKSISRKVDEAFKKTTDLERKIDNIPILPQADVDKIKKQFEQNSMDSNLIASVLGQDGSMSYSKNRLPIGEPTSFVITVEDREKKLTHNGLGFNPGITNTLSYVMVTKERDHAPYQVSVNPSNAEQVRLTMSGHGNGVPSNLRYTGTGTFVNLPKVYNGDYDILVEAKGYLPYSLRVPVRNGGRLNLLLVSSSEASLSNGHIKYDFTAEKVQLVSDFRRYNRLLFDAR